MIKQKCVAKILEKTLGFLFTAFLSFHSTFLFAQDPQSAILLDFRYGFQAPFGEMKDRFGGNNDFGIGVEMI